MIENVDFTRYVWVYFIERMFGTTDTLGKFRANKRMHCAAWEVTHVMFDDGGEVPGGTSCRDFVRYR